MAAIKGRNTEPELTIRSVLDTFKIGYDLHTADVPRKPDMVLPRRKKVIFVYGCFWHMHRYRYGRVKPAANWRFWRDKRDKNRERDKRNRRALRRAGWEVLTVWECCTKRPKDLIASVAKFLTATGSN